MRVLENFLSSLMRDGQRLRDFLQATLEQRGFREAHLEARIIRHDLLAMLITAGEEVLLEPFEPLEAERS